MKLNDCHKYIFVLVGIFFASAFCGCQSKPSSTHQQDTTPLYFQNDTTYTTFKNKTPNTKRFSLPDSNQVILDSLSVLKISDSLSDGYRVLQIDGEAHFQIHHAPVLLLTGMMKIKTKAVDFKITAYHDSPGQSLKVFDGRLIATKSYQSDFPNTDTLVKGEMILINRDIDLMEKETFDTSKTTSIHL